VPDGPEVHQPKDLAQPVMHQGSEEYRVWARQAYEQYGQAIKTLGIQTK
jgi:hypothetical protein